jgi:hypothetical protein
MHPHHSASRSRSSWRRTSIGSVRVVRITFTKLSDQQHTVLIERSDGTSESVDLDSRSFLRHDLAHFAVELELGLDGGVWGSVARGGSLSGDGLDGTDMVLAETVSGPMQTMMRTHAGPGDIHEVLERVAPSVASMDLAERLHARMRTLRGQWLATAYGAHMVLTWPQFADLPTASPEG